MADKGSDQGGQEPKGGLPKTGKITRLLIAALAAFALSVLVNGLNCFFHWWPVIPW